MCRAVFAPAPPNPCLAESAAAKLLNIEACAAAPELLSMGEYGLGVEGDENDETCNNVTNSCVAFVNFAKSLQS